jgi:hypothetical protein
MTTGKQVIEAVRKKLTKGGVKPKDRQVADYLGMHAVQLSAYQDDTALTPLKIANLIERAVDAERHRIFTDPISPIVEFYPLDAQINERGRTNYELFNVKVAGEVLPYRQGVKDALRNAVGVYVFYDSRGRALYVGQAKRQPLWDEMKAAFNRDRRDLQMLRRVNHDETAKEFRPYEEKRRKLLQRSVFLSDIARYFTAYKVHLDLIDEVEALMIRAFANDLLNQKMEDFAKAARRAAKEYVSD